MRLRGAKSCAHDLSGVTRATDWIEFAEKENGPIDVLATSLKTESCGASSSSRAPSSPGSSTDSGRRSSPGIDGGALRRKHASDAQVLTSPDRLRVGDAGRVLV